MNETLSRCKCGGKAHMFRYDYADWSVECAECGLKVDGDTMQEARDNWERKVKE